MNYGVQRERERRHGGAGDCDAAGADRRMEISRRRRTALDLRCVRVGQEGGGTAGSGTGFAAGATGAGGEYVELGRALTELGQDRDQGSEIRDQKEQVARDGPAVHALFVYNSNPGAVAPNQNAVRRGMARTDLFTVVHELFFTDTTDYADYILPATTFLEHTDIQGAYGHYFVQLSKQAIEPPGEARSNVWLFGQLAQRMGFNEDVLPRHAGGDDPAGAGDRAGWALDERGDGAHHVGGSEARRGIFRWRFTRPETKPFSRILQDRCRRLRARLSFIRRRWRRRVSTLFRALFLPPSRDGVKMAERYPLEFLSRKADNYMNSTFANLDGHRKMEARTSQRLEMHPDGRRGARDCAMAMRCGCGTIAGRCG